jgi:ribonuclease T2
MHPADKLSLQLPSKAYIEALTSSGSLIGGLLTAGTWSTQTLATATIVGTSSSFTLSTSKGACGVTSGAFSCGSGVSATKFSAVAQGSSLVIAYNGATGFTSDGTPSSSKTYPVYTGTGRSVDYSLAIVAI